MTAIFRFTGHVLGAMLKGGATTGFVVGLPYFAIIFLTAPGHRLTLDVSAVFVLVIAALAAAVALIYLLSHLEEVHHALQRYSAGRQAQRR
jgi:heme/copper-type cytochrome/quinol oxidase subunit 4